MSFLDTRPAPIDALAGLDPFAEFRVDAPREVAALLRELVVTGAPILLSAPDGTGLRTVLWSVDEGAGRISMRAEAGDPQLQALLEGDEATAVAYLDAVKLQFELVDLTLVRGARTCALQSRLPPHLYRFQRRSAYRVRTLQRTGPNATLRHPSLPDMQLRLRVLDVSVGGCALLLPSDVPPLQVGSTLRGVRVELDADTRFDAALELLHVTSIGDPSQGVRLGCALSGLDSHSECALQRYIDQTQKRHRLLSLS